MITTRKNWIKFDTNDDGNRYEELLKMIIKKFNLIQNNGKFKKKKLITETCTEI